MIINAQQTLVFATRWALYFVLAALFFQFRSMLFTQDQTKNYDVSIRKYTKRIFAAHGFAVYLIFYLFGSTSLLSSYSSSDQYLAEILLNFICIPFALLLWDGGLIWSREPKTIFLIGLHHIGVFIALRYHIQENPVVASRNTYMFGWLWFTHSFSFIQTYVLPLFGMKIPEGVKTPGLERMRYLYAATSARLMYSYFFAEGQPGFGRNYQTVALTTLLLGRFILNHHSVNWMRRIEIPGAIFVYSTAVCTNHVYWGMAVTFSIYVALLAKNFRKLSKTPAKWDPTHPKIASVISSFEKESLSAFPDGLSPGIAQSTSKSVGAVKAFCEGYPELQQKYPVIMAVAENDVEKMKETIKDGADIHADWNDSTAAAWAAHLGRFQCFIELLKEGINPWESSLWDTAERENIHLLLKLKAALEPVTLEAYPSVSGSIFQRFIKCIMEF